MKRVLSSCLLSLALLGCGGVPWRVVSQSNPNPLLGQKKFAVAPVDLSGATIGAKSEADYLAEKNDEDKKGWGEAKTGLVEEFTKGVRAGSASAGLQVSAGESGAPFILKPKVDFIEPGYYAYVSSSSSSVKMTVKIVSAEGKEIDEFLIEHATAASMLTPAVRDRLRSDGEALGDYAAQYLSARVAPK